MVLLYASANRDEDEFGSDADQFFIGEALVGNVTHCHFKPGLIAYVLAVVIPKRLLIEVAEQMERLDTT